MDINSREDFSKKPYFDDFKKENNFYKILFKPGTPVQTREMNNLQSMLQEQISTIGSHLFKNGSMVIPGTPRYNSTLSYIFIEKVSTDNTIGNRLMGKKITQVIDITENITLYAQVENWIDYGDKAMLLVNYLNSATITVAGVISNQKVFSPNTELSVEDSTEIITTSINSFDPTNVPVNGTACTLSVGEGVYYVDGYFVHTPEQKIVVGFNNDKLTIKSGFKVVKSVVTAYDDSSLFDNSLGEPNEGAPGADRFSIELVLTNLPVDDEETNFVELIRLDRGNLRVANINPNYNVLADTMARRTFDESGDYAVRGFDPKVYEHLKDSDNPSGFLTKPEGGDSNLFVTEISEGKGYVKGYEAENPSNYFLEVTKARTKDCEKTDNDVIQVNEYGEFIYLAPGNQFFDISRHPIIWLTDGQESVANIIGYCIPKFMQSVNISGQTIFKLYGTFQLMGTSTFGWQNLGGWRLNQLKNGPVLQVLNMVNVVSDFNVVDGQPLTSHVGYTPYAWDKNNRKLYVKKTRLAPPFDKTIAVTKGSASGYVTSIDYRISNPKGPGELFKLSLNNIKTTKDALGNYELQTDVAFSGLITTDANGYGEYTWLGNGVFVGQPVAANTAVDVAYFDNIVDIQDSGKKLVISNAIYPNSTFAISASLRKSLAIKSKSLNEGFTIIENASTRKMFLNHKDVYRIKAIYMSADHSTAPVDTDEDIKEYYDLINNDTIDFYNNSSIKSKSGFGIPKGQIKVVYDYFLHSAGDVFTADSYVSLRDNPADDNDVTHIGRIPYFKTKENTYVLSDYLDFRKPVRNGFFMIRATATQGSKDLLVQDDYRGVIQTGAKIYANGYEDTPATITSITETKLVSSENSDFTGVINLVVNASNATSAAEPFDSSISLWSAISDSTVTYDATYFVDRYDRVVISLDGQIRYIYGVPGINRYPEVPADSMGLVSLIVPAYTRNANQIKFNKDNNRRYTMRDIGKLDTRIGNLEYYTTLTMKELDTKNVKILDADGFDRFKSGLFVSNFRDFGVFNPFAGDEIPFKATLIPEQNKLVPLQYSDFVPLELSTVDSTNYRIIKNKIYMPFVEKVEIQQPYATHYQTLNPYLVVDWNPDVKLEPSTDAWIETEWAPVVNNVTNLVNNTTSSSVVNTGSTVVIDSGTTFVSGYYGAGNNAPAPQTNTVGSSSSVTTSTTVTQTTSFSSTSSTEYRMLGTSVIPLCRTREIHFTMTGSKPNTRYWVRFDNTDVTGHCCPYNPTTQVRGTFGEPLISDNLGTVNGIFQLPPATFKTGQRVLELTDINVSVEPDALPECVGTATYTANGTLQTMQQIVNTVNTTTNNTHTTTTNNTQVTVSRQTVVYNNLGDEPVYYAPEPEPPVVPVRHGDPLAQSFYTTEVIGPGMFVTKVDIFFAKKDSTAPAFLELKEMVNGTPAETRIKGSLCFAKPSDVTVSADSTVPTTFKFDEPIYLQSNRQYAFIVGSSSSRYAIWVSRMGEKVINEDRIVSEQPSLGSLFKSQNNSTWTAYQLEDIKFKLWRAQFDVNAETNLYFDNVGSGAKRKLNVSKISTTQGSNLVKIYHPNHGTQVNEHVKLYAEDGVGITDKSPLPTETFNGILMSDIYGVNLVKQVISINEYMIEASNVATVTGTFDDFGRYFYGESNINFSDYRISVNEFVPGNCSVRYSSKLITGKDFAGGQTTMISMPEVFTKNNENNPLSDVGLVQIQDNETTSKSMKIRALLKTYVDTVSPVLELNNNGVNVLSYALNKPSEDDEDLATGGSVNSKAITQVIRLTTLSNSIRIYTVENKQEKEAIEVWIRTAVDRNIEEKTWHKIEPTNIAIQADTFTYIEHERVLDNISEFDEYQIKILFKGTDTTKYPSINELRAISIAS